MLVSIEKPTRRREEKFLAGVQRSRGLHRGTVSPPSTPEEYRHYVTSLRGESRRAFFVAVAEADDIVGVVNVNEIVRRSFQSAYLGYYAFVPFAGRGLMHQGLKLVLDHCFQVERLHRLEANIQPGNERSIALIRKLGFRLEGFSPRYLKVSGRWRDHERWAILAEEWRHARRSESGR